MILDGWMGWIWLIGSLLIIGPEESGSRALDPIQATRNPSVSNISRSCDLIPDKFQSAKDQTEGVRIVPTEEVRYLRIYHPLFDVSAVVPGILYHVGVEIPGGHDFLVEHWGLVEGHVKHRHGRERRKDLVEMFPGDPLTNGSVISCSKNSFGGSWRGEDGGRQVFTFRWYLVASTPPALPSSVAFRLRLRRQGGILPSILEQSINIEVKPNCVLGLKVTSDLHLSSSDFHNPHVHSTGFNCSVHLQPPPDFGLTVTVFNLSVIGVRGHCSTRFISFPRVDPPSVSALENVQVSAAAAASREIRFCGKLQDFSPQERRFSFDFPGVLLRVSFPGVFEPRETFSVALHPSSPCEGLMLTELSGRTQGKATHGGGECSIQIHVPYGYSIDLQFWAGDDLNSTLPSSSSSNSNEEDCESDLFLDVRIRGGLGREGRWCIGPHTNGHRKWTGGGNRVSITFKFKIFNHFLLTYESLPIKEIVGDCGLGQVRVGTACVGLTESVVGWAAAEEECVTKGGHLATVQDEEEELLLHRIITSSALFHPSRGYWIGGNDREAEGHFQWSSTMPFTYSNWYPGWVSKGNEILNAQPNDDGLSGQDCVELRLDFGVSPIPSKGKRRMYWNDRNCDVQNFFLCQVNNVEDEEPVCNRTLEVGEDTNLTFSSPSHPSSYPDNTICWTTLHTQPGHQLIVQFSEFHLEDSPGCKYDYLEMREEGVLNGTKRFCGDWNKRLKLLRYISTTTSLTFKFESDFSHHFPGFKATVRAEKDLNEQCADQHMASYGPFCYLIVPTPALNWKSANQHCSSLKGNLASVSSWDEWTFLVSAIGGSGRDKSAIYWLGGSIDPSGQLIWADRMPFNFSAFHPSDLQSISEYKCLAVYWHDGSGGGGRGGGVNSWRLSDCSGSYGYICKKNIQGERREIWNRTYSGTGGKLSSPNYPAEYGVNVATLSHLIAPGGTRIVIRFLHLDVEAQEECLYDYIQIIDRTTRNVTRYCGSHLPTELTKLDFVSSSNEVDVSFVSDSSGSGVGFELVWRAVDVSSCVSGHPILASSTEFSPHPTPTSIHTPNFSHFNLPGLNCVFNIVAPAGQRIWLNLDFFEIGIGEERDPNHCSRTEDHVIIELSDPDAVAMNEVSPFLGPMSGSSTEVIILCGNLSGQAHLTAFLSVSEKMRIRLISPEGRTGRGFRGTFKAIPGPLTESLVVGVGINGSTQLRSLNYPYPPPPGVNLSFAFTTPPNYIMVLRVVGILTPNCHLKASSYLKLVDPYGGNNGTTLIVCAPNDVESTTGTAILDQPTTSPIIRSLTSAKATSVSFRTSFNRLEVTQFYTDEGQGIQKWSAQFSTTLDENFRAKVLAGGDRLLLLNACAPNPCANGGNCVSDGDKHICRCQPPFTGPFCGLSLCDLNPCLFGDCFLEDTSFRCVCQLGYGGERCDRRSKPCDERPCSGHGECVETDNVAYRCLCHAFWEGPRCESRMQRIPYRPLSERMLREPFWLGIITVAVVLLFITLVWCLKRHFPEKLEKLLNDDFDRNRGISWVTSRSPSSFRLAGGALGLREPIPSTSSGQAVSPQTSRSFLGRLGIRKPSLLSISSATSVSVTASSPHTYENRTFSLDDLLRPSRSSMMMRTPSPHRRRNFSIHVRRDPSEKQLILQQLVSSGNSTSLDSSNKPATPKPTIAEIIQMSEKRLRLASASSMQDSISPAATPSTGEKETSFSHAAGSSSGPTLDAAAQSKAEKKVTFARLMDKLAATERSSSSSCSDVSCGEEKVIALVGVKPTTKKDRKGRFRRSKAYSSRGRSSETDQEGPEMSSSDTTPDPIYPPRFPSRACVSPTGLTLSPANSPGLKQGKKMASADSLLALFHRFSGSSSAPPSPQYSENEESSAGATPLSTPSSPRNSALNLNLNFRPPPAFHITTPETSTIEVPVIDPFSQSNVNYRTGQSSSIMLEVPMRDYCLSPIHEVPTPIGTPMHSPAVTPMLQRTRPPAIRIQTSSDVEPDEEENECPSGFPSPATQPQSRPFDIPFISVSGNESGDEGHGQGQGEAQPTHSHAQPPRRLSRDGEVLPDVLVHVPPEVTLDSAPSTDEKDGSSPRVKMKPPPLVFAANILSFFNKDSDRKDEGKREDGITIPILNVECATPSMEATPLLRSDQLPDLTAHSQKSPPCPWDLAPPVITINHSSEAESDSDTPMLKVLRSRPNLSFLSPFAYTSERVPSESNLSTSGYSSMASPCPSRCPSISPLCQMDSEDFHIHGPHCYTYSYSHSRRSSLTPASSRRSSLTGRRCSLTGTASSPLVTFQTNSVDGDRSLSLMSANNMAIFNESLEDMRIMKLKEMEGGFDSAVEIPDETETHTHKITREDVQDLKLNLSSLLQVPRKNLTKSRSFDLKEAYPRDIRRCRLKGESLDSKLNLCEGQSHFLCTSSISTGAGANETEKKSSLSPVSSRSDSPISEIGVAGGHGQGQVQGQTSPWTDSDGIYDCGSSEVQSNGFQQRKSAPSHASVHHLSPQQEMRRSGRRRNRRMSHGNSPRRSLGALLAPTASPVGSQRSSPFDNKLLLHHELPASILRGRLAPGVRSPKKRRMRAQPNLDATSSSSSIESVHSHRIRSNLTSPITIQDSSAIVVSEKESLMRSPVSPRLIGSFPKLPPSSNLSHEELSKASTSKDPEEENGQKVAPSLKLPLASKPRISRLRTISLQIRFLRRLEQSLIRKRETLAVKLGERRESTLSQSESTSECSNCFGSDDVGNAGLLRRNRQSTESISSYQDQDTEEPLLSKSSRRKKKPHIQSTDSKTTGPGKAKKKKMRDFR